MFSECSRVGVSLIVLEWLCVVVLSAFCVSCVCSSYVRSVVCSWFFVSCVCCWSSSVSSGVCYGSCGGGCSGLGEWFVYGWAAAICGGFR